MTSFKRYLASMLLLAVVGAPAIAAPPAGKPGRGPLKVFILAGQSNMQGAGIIKSDAKRNGGKGSLEQMVQDPKMAARTKRMVAADGSWVVDLYHASSFWARGRSVAERIVKFIVRDGCAILVKNLDTKPDYTFA